MNKDNDDIDMLELENNSKKHVIKVAKSMGIISYGNKSDILERIKNKVETYKKNKESIESDSTVNDLRQIKDIDIGETLFWKVFRNIYLFKTISSYLSIGIGIESFKYDDITSVKWLLDNNHIELLKDKIKQNRQLSFSYSHNTTLLGKSIEYVYKQLFTTLKKLQNEYHNIEETKFIIRLLFKNYSRQLGDDSNKISFIIESRSSVALEILFQEFNIKPTLDHLYYSIKYRSIKLTKLILDSIKLQEKENEIFEYKIWESISDNISSIGHIKRTRIPVFKIINYLLSINLLSTPIQPPVPSESHKPPCNYDIFESFKLGPIENDFILSELIESCYYIKHVHKFNKKQPSTMDNNEIDKIKSKFNKQELRSKLLEILSTKQGRDNLNIKKLYEMYLEFKEFKIDTNSSGQFNRIDYNIIYDCSFDDEIDKIKCESQVEKIKYNNTICKYITSAFKFGSLQFFKSLIKFYKLDSYIMRSSNGNPYFDLILEGLVGTGSNDDFYPPILFANCSTESNDKGEIIQFIDGMVEIMEETRGFTPKSLLLLLIHYDDIGLLKYYIDQLIKFEILGKGIISYGDINFTPIVNYINGYPVINFIRFIRSIEMFDFLFYNFKSNLFLQPFIKTDVLLDLGRTDILERFEQVLTKKEFDGIGLTGNAGYLYFNGTMFNSKLLKSICYMLSKSDYYKPYIQEQTIIHKIHNIHYLKKEFKYLKFIIENTSSSINYNLIDLVEGMNERLKTIIHSSKIKFLDWVLSERKQDIINGRCKFKEDDYSILLYLTGRLEELFSNNQIFLNIFQDTQGKYRTLKLIGSRGDTNSLGRILNSFSTITIPPIPILDKEQILLIILNRSVKNDKLNMFEYLLQHHNDVLLMKTEHNKGWFDSKEFKELIKSSISYDSLHVFDFFINKLDLKITSKQFNCSISNKSKSSIYNTYKDKYQ